MPCLRTETRARKGDLFSSAARENSQPADRSNLTEAVWKIVIEFRDDQTRLKLLIVETHPSSSSMWLHSVITGTISPDPRLRNNAAACFNTDAQGDNCAGCVVFYTHFAQILTTKTSLAKIDTRKLPTVRLQVQAGWSLPPSDCLTSNSAGFCRRFGLVRCAPGTKKYPDSSQTRKKQNKKSCIETEVDGLPERFQGRERAVLPPAVSCVTLRGSPAGFSGDRLAAPRVLNQMRQVQPRWSAVIQRGRAAERRRTSHSVSSQWGERKKNSEKAQLGEITAKKERLLMKGCLSTPPPCLYLLEYPDVGFLENNNSLNDYKNWIPGKYKKLYYSNIF